MEPTYFDLTLVGNGLSKLAIRTKDHFECELVDGGGKVYYGFILAKSRAGKALTICDIGFHRSETDHKYQPRLTFRRVNEKLEDKTVNKGKEAVRIPFHSGEDGYREFWKMIAFLHQFKDLVDMGEFHKAYRVINTDDFVVAFKSQDEAAKVASVRRLISEGRLTEDNIRQALDDTRRATLEEFKTLLTDKAHWQTYQKNHASEIKGTGEETCWHHFLKTNKWILGLTTDVRFIRDLVSEAEVGSPATDGAGSPTVDMLGISDYTVLIELKTPNTHVFTEKKKTTARANTWSFTDDFIDGISQCLGQKFDWDKTHKARELVDDSKSVINQTAVRTVDPRCVFVVGNKMLELPDDSANVDTLRKRDTFERFRRNNRNVDIFTFDELYERAYFIVHNKKPDLTFLKGTATKTI